MIIVKLIGGLGNQLFQYAIAKKIAIQQNVKVILDVTPFEKYKLHKYSLEHFAFYKRFATTDNLMLFNFIKAKGLKKLYYKILRKINLVVIIEEKQLNFDKSIFIKAKKNTYLNGYWQSEKYFSDIRDIILKDLVISKPLQGKNLKFANEIKSVNSISLHIRRADYVTNKETEKVHGVCDLNYYRKAIEYISNKIQNPVIYLFSDDINWAKENLKTTIAINFVEHNNVDTNYEDLRLMSLCKHNIIANSSFSWWGAWLNENPDKIVIAPKRWLNTNKFDYSHIVPTNWITM